MTRSTQLILTMVLVAVSAIAESASAEGDAEGADARYVRKVENPQPIEIARTGSEFMRTAGIRTTGSPATGEAVLDLNVTYTDSKIWNPASGRLDSVRLRSYQGIDLAPRAPFVSPLIEVYAGETVRITLNNKLPADPTCIKWGEGVNTPHCFNGTNLHTHGLWVNPGGNGDNVLISINPGVSFQYEYKIPPDHPAGTYWYHSHRHGSTAIQLSSGMAGALIIRGDQAPTLTNTGDIDTLLTGTQQHPVLERVNVLQQIQYACRGSDGAIKTNSDGTYRCEQGDVGGVESFEQFGPGSWDASGRYTSINGVVLPTFNRAQTGQMERWRMIHAGVRDTISLQFRKMRRASRSEIKLTAEASDEYVERNCPGEPVPMFLVAADGLTLKDAIKTDITVLQPGYRWDFLIAFPSDGDYCVVDAAGPKAGSVDQAEPSRQLLGFVRVEAGSRSSEDPSDFIGKELLALADSNMPNSVKALVSQDLQNGMSLRRFVRHKDVSDSELTGTQTLAFNIAVGSNPVEFQVNGHPYDPTRIDRTLMLGGVDEWNLSSEFAGHPFHIHINPFQIVSITDPDGKDVSGLETRDTAGQADGGADPQYRGLKGVWKDTLWLKNLRPPDKVSKPYRVVVRTRYERYIGDFVLHCHILDHEDQGMMQNIRIALPDGNGGTSRGHH